MLIVDIATRKSVGFSILGMVDLNQLAQMTCVFLVLPLAFLRETHITFTHRTIQFLDMGIDMIPRTT